MEEKTIKEEKNKKFSLGVAIILCVILVLIIGLAVIISSVTEDNSAAHNSTAENNSAASSMMDAKPIIYIYPEETTKVSVILGKPKNLTHTYPEYENSWEVIADPDGNLIDTKTGRNLYALYWEGISTEEPKMNEGFVVKGSDTVEFLEEKLEKLGLNEREANEFIIYWLPQLENNEYNFIRFQTMEEIEESMTLEIEPKPDTIIRVMMEWKALEEYIEIPEQKLETPKRNGYVVVEWGGTEIR